MERFVIKVETVKQAEKAVDFLKSKKGSLFNSIFGDTVEEAFNSLKIGDNPNYIFKGNMIAIHNHDCFITTNGKCYDTLNKYKESIKKKNRKK